MTLTKDQHTALLAAKDALWDKQIAAGCRAEVKSRQYLVTQYHVIRDLVGNATLEVEDAPTPDAPALWRDRDREDGSIRLGLVAAPYVTVSARDGGTFVLIDDDDETVGGAGKASSRVDRHAHRSAAPHRSR